MARKNLLRDLMPPPEAPGAPGATDGTAPPSPASGPGVDSRQPETPSGAPGADPAPVPASGPGVDSRQLETPSGAPRADSTPARPARGAIGAVGRSIADLKARALAELDPHLIDAGGLTDRLGHDPEDHARLMASLRDHGQQVPILVRPHPATRGRYQIVYGRRRVLALRDLGLPVRALVRDLDDFGLVLAQGQENTVRRDLSFIEKANFARQMVAAGYDRKAVLDALAIDKTVLSRMLTVTERVPVEVIAAIGSAFGIGRDRWLAFADLYAAAAPDPEDACSVIALNDGPGAETRFEALETWLAARHARLGDVSAAARRGRDPDREAPRRAHRETLRAPDGAPLAELTRKGDCLTLTFRPGPPGGFEDWLTANLADLHRRWERDRVEDGAEQEE